MSGFGGQSETSLIEASRKRFQKQDQSGNRQNGSIVDQDSYRPRPRHLECLQLKISTRNRNIRSWRKLQRRPLVQMSASVIRLGWRSDQYGGGARSGPAPPPAFYADPYALDPLFDPQRSSRSLIVPARVRDPRDAALARDGHVALSAQGADQARGARMLRTAVRTRRRGLAEERRLSR